MECLMKSIFAMCLIAVFSLQSLSVWAETYTAGKDYEILPAPVATRNKAKVEVVEVFWYGCSHCFAFEPALLVWKAKLPQYADFYQMPAMWSPVMKLHAQGFYVAKSLGILDKVHEPFFNALNIERKKINDKDTLAAFFARFGVERATFDKTIDSFGVESQVSLADSRARSYRIQGTPEIIVNGKYRVSTNLTGSQDIMLKVASFLIEKEKMTLPKQ